MQSLRTRRSQGPQKPQRAPSKLAKPGAGPTPRTRGSIKSRVDDKIKKRMSMRYADISSPRELDVPAVPNIPLSLIPGDRSVGPISEQDELVKEVPDSKISTREEDKSALDTDNFDADAYLKSKLANSTEAELKTLQSSLLEIQEETASELQRNVLKNYEEFVVISKEVSTLENEMLELKEALSEWKSMPSLLHIDDSATLAERKRAARSSVADLRILYANQMQTLHAQIEGSSKFAPTISGRHVVAEAEGISSLNAATYRVDHVVKFVVLDDLVLVARRKRRTAGAGGSGDGKWTAERCWSLGEMLVLDTKDSPSMTNVFKIRHGKETHVYRTDTTAEKKNILSQFRLVADELASRKRKEREGEHERRKTTWNGGRASFADNSSPQDWMADLARQAGITDGTGGAKEKAERDARWAGEWADDLTVAIALREWEKAVILVEQGKAKLSTTPPLASKLPLLVTSLITALLSALSHTSIRKSTSVTIISFLERLGAGTAARNTFLEMRSAVMKLHIRKIRFEGNVGAYVNDLAVVCFTGIKHTADWFLASFKENEVASSFVEWAKKQLESFADIFRKQVYTTDVDKTIVEDALRMTYMRSQKLLQEYGLDFRYLLNELLITKSSSSSTLTLASARAKAMPNETSLKHIPSGSVGSSLESHVVGSGAVSLPSASQLATTISAPKPTSTLHSYRAFPSRSPTNTPPPPVPSTPSSVISSSANASVPQLSYPSRSMNRTPVKNANSSAAGLAPPTPTSSAIRGPRSPTPTNPSSRTNVGQTSGTAPTTAPPPPTPSRSTNRPGSVSNHRPPAVAVPQREGMI